MQNSGYIVAFITVSSKEEAKRIADRLVDKKLAACVNIVPGITSIYAWKGKREKSKEILLIIKSESRKFKDIVKEVKALHAYEVPEIISVKIDDGNKDYLKWIKKIVE